MSSPQPSPTLVGRLAPSPTGLMHVGHARSFLLAWWSIRSRGGRILLRMEDLDRSRVKAGMADQMLRDLEWLGIDWDGPVWVQSESTEAIVEAQRSLVERGLAYPCICSRKEIQSMQSAPHAGESGPRYPGTCRGRFTSVSEAERASGRPAALRFSVPPGVVRFHDAFAGPFSSDVEREVGDFPIAVRSAQAAYQLAVVVDDGRAGVTEVLRGDDLLESTARQSLLQDALHLPHPTWIHVPLVVDEGGRRLAKRSDDLSIAALREASVDPRAIVTWVARHSGMEMRDLCTAREIVGAFDLSRVPHAPVVFGPEGRQGFPISTR